MFSDFRKKKKKKLSVSKEKRSDMAVTLPALLQDSPVKSSHIVLVKFHSSWLVN